VDEFDYDMVSYVLGQESVPGEELKGYFTSQYAAIPGALNLSGIEDPIVDTLVARISLAKDTHSLKRATRLLDAVLMAGHYMVPNWYIDYHRLAYWDRFKRPAISPSKGLGLETWSAAE
jgi:microcin C transport system substrate-binding protein